MEIKVVSMEQAREYLQEQAKREANLPKTTKTEIKIPFQEYLDREVARQWK